VVRTLLLESSVPPCFWCEALSTSVHLINHLPYPMINHVSLFLSCLVILLYILIFVHFVVFVFCISLLINDINLLLSLLSVIFLVILSLKRVMFVMIQMLIVYRNMILFENQYFFPSHVEQPSTSLSLLPSFSNSTIIMERFKPGFIYERHSRHESGSTSPVLPSDLDPMPNPAPTYTTIRRSTRPSRPPNWYGFFSHVSLVATLSTISILFCYKQAIKHEC